MYSYARKSMLLAALLLFAIPAMATNNNPPNPCGNHGNNCDPDPPPTSWDNSNEQNQNQDQQQGQAQGQGQGQNQTASGGAGGSSNATGGAGGNGLGVGIGQGGSATGGRGGAGGNSNIGDVGSTSGATAGALSGSVSGVSDSGNSASISSANGGSVGNTTSTSGSNSLSGAAVGDTASSSNVGDTSASTDASNAVNVDTSDRSVTNVAGNRTNINTFIPGDLPANAMTIAPGAYITVASDQSCGMLQQKVDVPVYQWNKRGTKKVQVGYDHELQPVFVNGVQQVYQIVPKANGGYYELGSFVTYVLSTKGSSNSMQLGAQGGGGGGYGGLSFGSGRSYSEAGAHVIIRSCVHGDFDPSPVVEFKKPRVPRG